MAISSNDEPWLSAISTSTIDSSTAADIESTTSAMTLYQSKNRFLASGILLVVGVLGNFLALVILARKKATKNSKYTLMLR